MVRIYCKLQRITFKAFLVEATNNKNKKVSVWLPKSQVTKTDCLAVGDDGYMEIPEWLANQQDLKGVDPSTCNDDE